MIAGSTRLGIAGAWIETTFVTVGLGRSGIRGGMIGAVFGLTTCLVIEAFCGTSSSLESPRSESKR